MSESDSIAAYQAALERRREAERNAARMAEYIADAGKKLANWKNVSFSNLDINFPAGRQYFIGADGWPSVREIAQAISDYHVAHNDAVNAYRRIPPNLRSVVVEPPREQ